MNNDKPRPPDIDDLVKQALKDDLPPDLERRMKAHFIEFRGVLEDPGRRSTVHRVFGRGRPVACGEWAWAGLFVRKEALAFFSVMLMVLGGAMHLAGFHSRLSDSVPLLKTSLAVSEQVRRVRSMEITAQAQAEGEPLRVYSIRWILPGRTRVDYSEGDTPHKTLWISEEGMISIMDRSGRMLRSGKGPAGLLDSQFQPAAGLLSPAELARCFNGRWEWAVRQADSRGEPWSFRLFCPAEGSASEIVIDNRTYLPRTMALYRTTSGREGTGKRLVLHVTFQWNRKIPQVLMYPGAEARRGQEF